jgi:hypothetical protein
MKGKGIVLALQLVLTTSSVYATTEAGDTRQAVNGINLTAENGLLCLYCGSKTMEGLRKQCPLARATGRDYNYYK